MILYRYFLLSLALIPLVSQAEAIERKMSTKEIENTAIILDKQQLTELKNISPILDSFLDANGQLWLLSKKSLVKWSLSSNDLELIDLNKSGEYSFQKVFVADQQVYIATYQGVLFYDTPTRKIEYVGISKYDITKSIRVAQNKIIWRRSKATYSIDLQKKKATLLKNPPREEKPFDITYQRNQVTVVDSASQEMLQKINVADGKSILKAKFSTKAHIYLLSDQSVEIYDLKSKTRHLTKGLASFTNIDKIHYNESFLAFQSSGNIYAYKL